MTFHWWWILLALAAVWIVGWWITVVVAVFFNPLDSVEDKRKDLRERFVAQSVLNFFLWPAFLPELLARRKLYRDMRTGKRPAWIVLGKGEESARQWTLSDGTEFRSRCPAARRQNIRTFPPTTTTTRSPGLLNIGRG